MKVYNFGNDYAFQRKQESAEKNQNVEPIVEQETNAENKIPGFGAGDVEDAMPSEEPRQEKETRKKKKETGAKAQPEEVG